MIKVLLIDDHPVVRSGYRRFLEQQGDIEVLAECGDAQDGYEKFVRLEPDVSVSDMSLPGSSGLDWLRRVIARQARARVLIFSMHDSVHLVRQAFQEGASGYVSKAANPDSLVAAVRRVHAGQRYVSDDIAPELSRQADNEDELITTLSHRELSVFRLLAQGISSADCARHLNLSPKTIANVQTVIKEKLQVKTSAALVHLAMRKGLISGYS